MCHSLQLVGKQETMASEKKEMLTSPELKQVLVIHGNVTAINSLFNS